MSLSEPQKTHVLVVDDDPGLRLALRKALGRKDCIVTEAEDGKKALPLLQTGGSDAGPFDVCVLDLKMPNLGGMEVLRRTQNRNVPVVVLTGHGSVVESVEAMRLGASNFVQKPVDADELWPILFQAIGLQDGTKEAASLIGTSRVFHDFLKQLQRAAESDEPVLLSGETGTGKKVLAQRLHEQSSRSKENFVVVNATCLSPELFDSELFGHHKNGFSGDAENWQGLIAQAGKGTLFIDEIGDLPLWAQTKLLRCLEEEKYRPVGSNQDQKFEPRVCAATNQDLTKLVEQNKFRKDLYYRLFVLPLHVPPLRHRAEDILEIAHHWLRRLGSANESFSLTQDAQELLLAQRFPGNIRELINLMKRAVLLHRNSIIDDTLLRQLLEQSPFASWEQSQNMVGPDTLPEEQARRGVGSKITLEELEKAHIMRLLERLDNISEVARIVGIDRRTLQRKMIAWGLRGDEKKPPQDGEEESCNIDFDKN
jgi:DNA-binding NtrC family response regulator